jgi:hypothetical protein
MGDATTTEELRHVVQTMIKLSVYMKAKRKEMSKVRATYKVLADRVKEYGRSNNVKHITLDNYQIRVYSQIREPALSQEFLVQCLQEYLAAPDACPSHDRAQAMAAYVIAQKKGKKSGKESWSLSIRENKPADCDSNGTTVHLAGSVLPGDDGGQDQSMPAKRARWAGSSEASLTTPTPAAF